jgi:hypothetical protein
MTLVRRRTRTTLLLPSFAHRTHSLFSCCSVRFVSPVRACGAARDHLRAVGDRSSISCHSVQNIRRAAFNSKGRSASCVPGVCQLCASGVPTVCQLCASCVPAERQLSVSCVLGVWGLGFRVVCRLRAGCVPAVCQLCGVLAVCQL